MKYYQVAPLSYLGKNNNVLTYSSTEHYSSGFAVEIPLRNKIIVGIVLKEVSQPTFQTKEIIKSAFKQQILSTELIRLAEWISDYYGSSLITTLQAMVPSGITKKRRKISDISTIKTEKPPALTTDQQKVISDIEKHFTDKPHLLFGVTGSGKTEIYMKMIEKTLNDNKQAIVLVPEISLTPQAVDRFQKRFGNTVAVLHSNLKETERFYNWQQILEGNKKIVIGSRSAIFAPCPSLGLIVIDEEHDPSYKQENNPKYDAIDVALKRKEFEEVALILGSATPKIETFFKAQNNLYFLHQLNKRIVQTNLPNVEIVDMRHEFRYGNKSIFSEKLQNEINHTINNKKQVLLFINRRGMSTFVSCRDCGYVEKCPNCDISLTFHYNSLNLECHHCGFIKSAPITCPDCKSTAIKYFGTGTQKVEQELKKLVNKNVRISRMDTDSTKIRGAHENIYNQFSQGEIDILIGTQMITKGWDLENVGLVGIVSADTALNFPDFTASERTFNLLTQVAGRTGRGKDEGKVIIQTYNPENFAIRRAAKHDYLDFYKEEIKNRQELNYPPFANLIKLLYNNSVQSDTKIESEKVVLEIENILKTRKIAHQILGPAPAFVSRINNKYFYQITIKLINSNEKEIIKFVSDLNKFLSDKWSIDVDPADLI